MLSRRISPYHAMRAQQGSGPESIDVAKGLLARLPVDLDGGGDSLPFANLADALKAMSESRNSQEQRELVSQLLRRCTSHSDKELEVYLLLKMLLPSHDNESVYGMKTRRLMLTIGRALRHLGQSEGAAAQHAWLQNVPLQESLLVKGKVVCLPELVIATQCVRGKGRTEQGATMAEIGTVCRKLTAVYLRADNTQTQVDTEQKEILGELIERGYLDFEGWLAFVRILLKKVSVGVGPETVLSALPGGSARNFFAKQHDLARLARMVAAGGNEPSVVVCGVPFSPMTCHSMRSPFFLRWLQAYNEKKLDPSGRVIGNKVNYLAVMQDKRWFVPMTKAREPIRRYVDLESAPAVATQSRKTHIKWLREFRKAGFLASAPRGKIIVYRMMERGGEHSISLQILRIQGRADADQMMLAEDAWDAEERKRRGKKTDVDGWTRLTEDNRQAWVGKSVLQVEISHDVPEPVKLLKDARKTVRQVGMSALRARVTKADDESEEEEPASKSMMVQQKVDGDRIQVHMRTEAGGHTLSVSLFTKWGKDVSALYSNVRDEIQRKGTLLSKHAPCILDGELVVIHKETEQALPWSSSKWRHNHSSLEKEATLSELLASGGPEDEVIAVIHEGGADTADKDSGDEEDMLFCTSKGLKRWRGGLNQAMTRGRRIPDCMLRVVVYDIIMHKGKAVHDESCRARYRLLQHELQKDLKMHCVHMRVLEDSWEITDTGRLVEKLREVVERKQEGLVLKEPSARYEFGKSHAMHKLKLTGPEINAGVLGVGSTLSGNPRMCGLLTCVGGTEDVLLSYCRVESLQGAETGRAIEHVMTALESRASVGELEAAMKQNKGVQVSHFAVRMTSEEGGLMRRVRWRPGQGGLECEVLVLASDLTDIQWLVNPLECSFGLSVRGDLRPLRSELEGGDEGMKKLSLCWRPRNPVGRIEFRDFQMSKADTYATIQEKYEDAQDMRDCIEKHTLRRVGELRAIWPPLKSRLVEAHRMMQVLVGAETAVEVGPSIEELDTLLEQTRRWVQAKGGTMQWQEEWLRNLTPDERLAVHGHTSKVSIWTLCQRAQEKKSKHGAVTRLAQEGDAVATAEKEARMQELSKRLRELKEHVQLPVMQRRLPVSSSAVALSCEEVPGCFEENEPGENAAEPDENKLRSPEEETRRPRMEARPARAKGAHDPSYEDRLSPDYCEFTSVSDSASETSEN